MGTQVLVYADKGVSERGLRGCLAGLARHGLYARPVTARELLGAAPWEESCAALVVPGGADLPYCAALGADGCARIRRFVESGGSYVGLCAGAYFGSQRCEFDAGGPLEVLGARHLALFPGTAVGSVFPGFDYRSEAGAVAARVAVEGTEGLEIRAYVNGGPRFVTSAGEDAAGLPGVRVLARYADAPGDASAAAAAVRCAVGDGVAVLCGPHPETTAACLEGAAPAAYVRRLRQALADGDAGRERLWTLLLREARLDARAKAPAAVDALKAAVAVPALIAGGAPHPDPPATPEGPP